MCSLKEENIEHFMNGNSYGTHKSEYWKCIFENDREKQFKIGQEAKIRLEIRENKKEKDGLASSLAPTAPDRLDLYC